MTIYWAPFLHIYQPPWQDVDVLRRINKECYMPLFSMMERHPNAKITLNIQGCLLSMLEENGLTETVSLIQKLVRENKLEIVGTAMFHPILPLIPAPELIRQVKLNETELTKKFQPNWTKSGFFPPEMAVSPQLCGTIKELGYKWMIMGGIANSGLWPHDYLQKSDSGLLTLFRDDYISNEISFNKIDANGFVNKLQNMYNMQYNHYIITAQDGETFGHHIPFYETTFLGKVFSLIEDHQDVQVSFISDLLKIFPIQKAPPIRASTWSTDGADLASNVPYPLWKHPFNPTHKIQYRMLQSLYKLLEILEKYAPLNRENEHFYNYYQTARHFYDRALHSCWLWWASQRPHWSPNLIYKGVDLVLKTALNAQLALIDIKIGDGNEDYEIIMGQMEKLMTEMVNQELAGQRVRTF